MAEEFSREGLYVDMVLNESSAPEQIQVDMAFLIAFAIVEGDKRVWFEKLAKQLEVIFHQATIKMQHVELGPSGGEELEHLGAGSLDHLSFASLRQVQPCKRLLGAGVHVAGN